MTAATLLPDPTRCPDCRGTLAGTGTCPACRLPLSGPAAERLWQVDTELLRLEQVRGDLVRERAELIATLRGAAAAPAVGAQAPGQEWSAKRVQDLLLVLGGLLLAGAAVVFAAVTYERLGATGRALVLVALTLAAAAAAPRLRARGLRSTAEAVGAVALVLAALDAYGLRTLGLAQDSDALSYAAASAGVLAATAAAYARVVPLRVAQCAAVVLAQLPVPLLLVRYDATAATAGLALALLVAADLGVLAALGSRLPRAARRSLVAAAAGVLALALARSLETVLPLSLQEAAQPGLAAAALAACAAVLAGAGRLLPEGPPRWAATAAAVPVLALAVHALREDAPPALVLAVVALLVALAADRLPATWLPATWRTGPLAGAVLTVGAGAALVAAPALEGLLLPFTWLFDPWALPAGSRARDALAPVLVWAGSLTTPAVLLVAALTAATAGRALARPGPAAAPAALLGTAGIALLPLALDLPYAVTLAALLLLAVALVAAAAVLLRSSGDRPALAASAAAVAVVLLAAAWSTASEGATLVVLPLAALALAGLAVLALPVAALAAALAGLLAAGELAAVGASRGLAGDQVGALLLLAVAALLAVAPVLDAGRGTGAEVAAATVAVVAVALASSDVGWSSWTLAGLGVLALATALRPDRRRAAALGGLLLTASSWVRLHDAGVTAPEPYVLPLAALALALGHLRRRREPGTPSWSAYGPGLSLALVPSLLQSFEDASLTRPLLLALAASAVVLVGAGTRLQAPLAIGGAVLAVDALQLLGPYAAALPRWLSLGVVGALLLAVGATYEQRRQDVDRLRERYGALS